MPKHWTPDDDAITSRAVSTGRLPDGRVATQERLAGLLGFSRQTITKRLNGAKLPLSVERMGEGGRSSGYARRVRRIVTILQHTGGLRR